MDVVVLAGGSLKGDWSALTSVTERWQLPVHGEPILDRVCRAAAPIGDLVVVGGPNGLPAGQHFIESLSRGVNAVKSERMMLITADMPDFTTEDLRDVIARTPDDAEIAYPIIPLAACEARYPGVARTSLRLREGTFTGGNVAVMHTASMKRSMAQMEQAYAARKSPVRLAAILGFGTLVRVILGRFAPQTLPIPALERAATRALKSRVRAVITEAAALGTDIDKPEQYAAWLALNPPALAPRNENP
ncbi:MAG TPA: NTP transferase domain-containing protein [Fimbriimonadaceae bacterium]|nr:hypothetical protein [Armatimonadota bacterium]HCM73410.1 hypothetical protein [Armatimonadota bacterium]HRD32103.1 NTP transferase domain-containing protein [Fimbriimonadaceae bacterium]HRE93912.1 NTP transferase domain-containing protein [Fimbriimonadaceae bacterium]HRI72952.1 NTP transferase domain-containing protein [Fimbriimonadaceae bacterium]